MEDSSFGNISGLELMDHLLVHDEFEWPQNSSGDHQASRSVSFSSTSTQFCDGDNNSMWDDQHMKGVDESVAYTWETCTSGEMVFNNSKTTTQGFHSFVAPHGDYYAIDGAYHDHLKPKIEEAAHDWSTSCRPFSMLNFDHSESSRGKDDETNTKNTTTATITTKWDDVQAHNHVLAERKRRQRLNQRLIALSALLPGLKKMDKASVLEDAVKYMKQLQERVKILEEPTTNHTQDHDNVACESADSLVISREDQLLPDIKVRSRNKDVLISLHCRKRAQVLRKMVAEIENLHLSVVNTSVMPFGDSSLNITIIARKDDEADSDMNMKEVVDNLFHALKASIN